MGSSYTFSSYSTLYQTYVYVTTLQCLIHVQDKFFTNELHSTKDGARCEISLIENQLLSISIFFPYHLRLIESPCRM